MLSARHGRVAKEWVQLLIIAPVMAVWWINIGRGTQSIGQNIKLSQTWKMGLGNGEGGCQGIKKEQWRIFT